MDPDPHTEELRLTQADRERAERRLADEAPEEQETAQHERRADKARYLREKLEDRAESEREGEGGSERSGGSERTGGSEGSEGSEREAG